MFKEQMDASTILFKGNNYSKAYDLEFLNENFNTISKSLQTVEEIYYKPRYDRSSWFDYKTSLIGEGTDHLSYIDSIYRGSELYKLSPMLEELPQTEFIDKGGYKYMIGPRDGLDTSSVIKERKSLLKMNITKKLVYNAELKAYQIIVDFKASIRDALITFNGLFEDYEIYNNDYSKIVYTESKDLEFPRFKDAINLDLVDIDVYMWEGVSISDKIKPILMDKENWFKFDREINSGYLLFYNKVMYYYDINTIDDTFIKIIDVDEGYVNNFDLDKMYVRYLTDSNDLPVRQQRLIGFLNDAEDVHYFPTNISNALITYNGVNHGYSIVHAGKAVKYLKPYEVYDPQLESYVFAINFYSGDIPAHRFTIPSSAVAQTANNIIQEYKNKLDLANSALSEYLSSNNLIVDDYEDELVFNPDKPTVLRLNHIPELDSLSLYINGVRYDEGTYFIYNKDFNTIEWKFTAINNGFDLSDDMTFVAVYDYFVNNN